MTEELAQSNGIEIAYETFGDPGDPALLLIMGLGMQMVGWDPDFCELLAGEGFYVIRFDNRDVGQSTKVRGGPKPNVLGAMLGRPARASYELRDMAADAVGLLDHLDVHAAHLVGASMGGMIAQTMALEHPERVLSLASIMSTTGERRVGRPRLRAFGVLLRKAPRDREAFIEYTRRVVKTIGSPGFPTDDERLRRRAAESFDRCYYPAGIGRQMMAIMASGDRTERLPQLDLPTVVIHGKSDPLIPVRAGRATAAAIPGAELIEIDGWGHDLPPAVWPRLVEAIARNGRRAEDRERSGAWR
jgi:pimeloyl-ACP methyl ester carboxylesterase